MNYAELLLLAQGPRQAGKVKLHWEEMELGFMEVSDSYYGEPRDFEKVYEIIERTCGALAKKLN